MTFQLLLTALFLSNVPTALGGAIERYPRADEELGRTPHMGWSGWNVAQCDSASAEYALKTANQFLSLGLKDLGYEYVNIDDCWSLLERGSDGNLVPDPSKWPDGIKAVANEIQAMGLKLGLYGCAGKKTCAGYPGSEGHEVQDAEQLAQWNVDFWKHDNCYTPCLDGPDIHTCQNPAGNTTEWYATMRDALAGVEDTKVINFNLCQWGRDQVWTWGKGYGQSWRMSEDNWGDWESVQRIGSAAAAIWEYSAPGGFNDLDMLFVGNGVLTEAEERLHFGLWAIAKSPLVIGTDLDSISDQSLAIVSNKGIIEINQDSLGVAATTFQPPGAEAPLDGIIHEYWAGPLSDGVVIGLAAGKGAATLSVQLADVPGLSDGSYSWQELYSGQAGEGDNVSFDLVEHDMAIVKVIT